MPYSIRLSLNEERLLVTAQRALAKSRSEVIRQAIVEYCSRLGPVPRTAFEQGRHLFGRGGLAKPSKQPLKRAVQERLRAKHGLG